MKSIKLNESRNGNFTSSEIYALTTNGVAKGSKGDPYYTYIEEKIAERRLERSISNETTAKPLSWGKLNEQTVMAKLGKEYRICSTQTMSHPTIPFWKGSPDCEKFKIVRKKAETDAACDIKCPMTLKSFCKLVDLWKLGGMDAIRKGFLLPSGRKIKKHPDGEKFYWQLVSNAILLGAFFAELIVYCPYEDELEKIRELANQQDGPDIHQYYWISMGLDGEMPYLKRGGYYTDINVMRFFIPNSDRELLTSRVLEAGKELTEQN